MQRFIIAVLFSILLCGCGTSPVDAESTREIVLQYLGGDVGTAGPFGKGGKKELDVLSDVDRKKAETLIDQGASLFLVFGSHVANAAAAAQGGATRVVLVQRGRIVADFVTVSRTPAPGA